MRSRYVAFVKNDIRYIKETQDGEAARSFDEEATRQWARQSEWQGLKILNLSKGQAHDAIGTVEFVATYRHQDRLIEHHEISDFEKDLNGLWKFVSSKHL